MAKQTLLEMTQNILAEMNSDEVNSISDTTEATSVASIIKQVYLDLSEEMDLPGERNLSALQPYSDLTKPNYLKIPDAVNNIIWLKYDIKTSNSGNSNYIDITYQDPGTFIKQISGRPSTDTTNYQIVKHSTNINLIIAKKIPPTYWTSFDDNTVVFDAYDINVDNTLQASKSMCLAEFNGVLDLADASVPALPENLFRLLYTQSLTRCFADLKTQVNQKAERNESRLRVRAQRNKWAEGRMVETSDNYGRK
jgi:hypothetical protein